LKRRKKHITKYNTLEKGTASKGWWKNKVFRGKVCNVKRQIGGNEQMEIRVLNQLLGLASRCTQTLATTDYRLHSCIIMCLLLE
jgi:hypothetical protein